MRPKLILIVVGLALLLVGGGFSWHSIRQLRAELLDLRIQLAGLKQDSSSVSAPERPRSALRPNDNLSQRVAHLEQTVNQLARVSDYLMERGQIPLATNKVGDLLARLGDVSASDAERLRALRLLRRKPGII